MMSDHPTEIEVKFYVSDLKEYENRLQLMDAECIQTRTYEYNLLFDNASRDLSRCSQILRLRKDVTDRLTYKGPGTEVCETQLRPEIEVTVSDFEATKALLEALGFEVCMIYEKFRTIYDVDGVLVCLDEMPYGKFIEIEGPDGNLIKEVSLILGLKWEARILDSYAKLLKEACRNMGIQTTTLTFSYFSEIEVMPDQLGIHAADQ